MGFGRREGWWSGWIEGNRELNVKVAVDYRVVCMPWTRYLSGPRRLAVL